jgi:hypothetical protein
LTVGTHVTSSARTASAVGSMTCGSLYAYGTFLERLAQDLQDVPAKLRQLIEEEYPVVRQRDFPRNRHLAAADQPHVGDGGCGVRQGRAVTSAVRAPVRPATRWTRVVSRASARVIGGSIVVRRRASMDAATADYSGMTGAARPI